MATPHWKWLLLGVCFTLIAPCGFSEDAKPKAGQAAQTNSGDEPQVNITPRVKKAPGAQPAEEERRSNIRIDTTLVLVPVSVTDPMNRFVTGLEKDHFKVFEDKIEQDIRQFSSEDAPLSVGIVFDTSGSMGSKLQKSRQAVAQFLKTANPEDEFFLIQFNDRPELTVPFTRNTEDIQNRLTFTQPKGRTALLDGIYLSMNQMKKAHNPRKALLVISDGGDNSSRYTEAEVRKVVRESDVLIYSLGIFESYAARGRTPEELAGPGLLSELAEQTGGRHFAVDDLAELPDMAAKIGIELRNRYVIGYSPKNQQRDGRYHHVEVKVVTTPQMPRLRAYWRPGYYAPLE
jgi:VWFA-related protein